MIKAFRSLRVNPDHNPSLDLDERAAVLSNHASRIMAGPRVISRKSREGGYFVTFNKEMTVNEKLFCVDQRDGSP